MGKPELHLFILWQNALDEKDRILADIRTKFEVVRIFAITWTPEFVSSNFTRFYGTFLPNRSFKEKECGTGTFYLIVVWDKQPQYEHRITSHGGEDVNVGMFDAKYLYRSWTKGGHKVHGTTSIAETNHNLTLLLGLNTEDFLLKYPDTSDDVISLNRDIEGAQGWNSLHHLFYVLNATTPYVILRGEKEILDNHFPENHLDVDIMLEAKDYENAKYIINGVSCCNQFRPHERILIEGNTYYIDIWRRENNYFDNSWSAMMLQRREFKDGLYVLNREDKFYSLLYHCFFVKGDFEQDYLEQLHTMRKELGFGDTSYDELLLAYLKKNRYVVIRPNDKSIELHFENELLKQYVLQYGLCVSTTVSDDCLDVRTKQPISWTSRAYDKGDSIIKEATPSIIDHEVDALNKLKEYPQFPHVLRTFEKKGLKYVEISKVPGISADAYFKIRKNRTFRKYKAFITQALDVLEILYTHHIGHRDFIPQNLLLEDDGDACRLYCIDFGWSVDYTQEKDFVCPPGLTGEYAGCKPFSDFYTFSMVLHRMLVMPYTQRIIKTLQTIRYEDYFEEAKVLNAIRHAKKQAQRRLGIMDIYGLLRNRYARVNMFVLQVRDWSPQWLWDLLRKNGKA